MARSFWWLDYGMFEPDASGLYPLARQVVAHYRRFIGWSCTDLAAKLDITVRAVNRVEREGLGLDAVSRLRELCLLLEIPPVLLGLCDAPGSAGWWVSDYEPWQSGSDSWPVQGCIVKFYRKRKGWTQEQLASALGITALAVRKSENMGTGLDSLTRRRALRFLLAIPPVLLGLDSEHLAKEFGGTLIGSGKSFAPELVTRFRASADVLLSSYHTTHSQDHVSDTLSWLADARELRLIVHGNQRNQMLEAESLGYQALALITKQYAPDVQVFSYSNQGVALARLSSNNDLLAVSLQRRGGMLLDKGYVDLAQRSINEALLLPVEDESLLLSRFVDSARILASVAANEQDRSTVFALLDQSRPFTGQDTFNLQNNSDIVTIRRAQTYNLLAAHAPQGQARELLRRSSDLLAAHSPDSARRSVLAKLAFSQACIGLNELDGAATLAIESIPLVDQIKSSLYLPQFLALYRTLCKGKLRHDPSVARLGLYLHEHGAF